MHALTGSTTDRAHDATRPLRHAQTRREHTSAPHHGTRYCEPYRTTGSVRPASRSAAARCTARVASRLASSL
eukprot:8891723-Alexandrium_andersonii.AAC.1